MVNAQQWLDQNYPKKEREKVKTLKINSDILRKISLLKENEYLEGSLNLEDFINLQTLDCSFNKLTSLILNICLELVKLDCSHNLLVNLEFKDLNKLEEFNCRSNYLTELDYLSLNPNSLIYLNVIDNNLSDKNIEIFSKFINLKELLIGNDKKFNQVDRNYFSGSTDSVKNLNLNRLHIGSTNVNCNEHDFNSQQKRKDEQIKKEIEKFNLFFLQKSNNDWKEVHQDFTNELQQEWKKWGFTSEEIIEWIELADLSPWDANFAYYLSKKKSYDPKNKLNEWKYFDYKKEYINHKEQLVTMKVAMQLPRMPSWLAFNKISSTNKNFCYNEEIKYENIFPEEFHWKIRENKKNLPIKIYNTRENKVVWTKSSPNISSYAIMSYVWGDLHDPDLRGDTWEYAYQNEDGSIKNKQIGVSEKDNATGTTKWSIKALKKAIATCQLPNINIEYLWMDQLCIDQFNVEEVNREVPKMRQYYENASATLISIEDKISEKQLEELISSFKKEKEKFSEVINSSMKILIKVINSQWFSRSWTFQEGWLSKHTIFMFDDYLVDGRLLSITWAEMQPQPFLINSEYRARNFREYCRAFVGKTATPIGWVYYENGYTSEDKISLRLDEALRSIKEKKRSLPIDGIYSILGLLPYGEKVKPKYKKWGEKYSKEELEQALFEVMKIAVENGYGDPFAWQGLGSDTHGFCWLPKLDEKTGSSSVIGGIKVKCKEKVNFTKYGIEITSSEYTIRNPISGICAIDGGQTIDGGLKMKDFAVELGDDKWKRVTLQGSSETLEKIRKGHTLVIPKGWETEKDNIYADDFALLVSITDNENVRHRIDSIRLYRQDRDKLIGSLERKLIIGFDQIISENTIINDSVMIHVT